MIKCCRKINNGRNQSGTVIPILGAPLNKGGGSRIMGDEGDFGLDSPKHRKGEVGIASIKNDSEQEMNDKL